MNSTPPPPDKQPAAETLEEITEKIIEQIPSSDRDKVTRLILSALRNERERCAKLAELMATGETYGTGRQKAINIAAAIREGK